MERENRVQQNQTENAEQTNLEGAGATLAAPAFQFADDGADGPPIQRQDNPNANNGAADANLANQQADPQHANAEPDQVARVNLGNSVGQAGTNNPADVRQVQDRLVTLGYLSAADFQTEQVDPTQANPIADATIRATIVAISQYMSAAFGRPGLLLEPNQASGDFLNNAPPQALGGVAVGDDVGAGAQNNAADVRNVQLRLRAIDKLSVAALAAEGVAADAAGRIADANLVETIAAINDFNITVVGTSLSVIRANSHEQELLNNPPRFEAESVSMTNSVGTGGQNNPADVVAVQTRLNGMGYLTAAHLAAEQPTAEQVAADPVVAIAVGNLVQTIAAINQFEHAMSINQTGLIAPGSEGHRQLINPNLPEKGTLNIGSSVGRGGVNARADVRFIQDRLQAVGVLSTSHYLSEQVDPALPGAVDIATIPNTQAALEEFCEHVAGSTDGRIDANGRAERLLNDPTYGTTTNYNLEANNGDAGYDFQSNDAAVNRTINAIEAIEAGHYTGEIGAVLTNGAGVAASYGKGQVIGATGVGVLQGDQGMRDHYDLSQATLADMSSRARNTNTHYNATYAQVPAGGSAPGALDGLIAAYQTANGERFVQETGLGLDDIARMFHTANMRRRILAVNVARNRRGVITDRTQVNPQVTALQGNANFSNSTDYLGINTSSLRTYFRNTATMGENRAAFQTKAVFNHPEGQKVRNAMTDDNGTAIGRTFVETTYGQADNAVAANARNRGEVVAAITAIMHNRGGTAANWAGQVQTVYGDAYVGRFLPEWRANP